ncbi:hypothetical protein RI129_007843 [Pyrocoelia pectoralis]|uniref:ZP domain-containing protein n=1 Tax=Pyrocoelia pectoralis TaxID=417401 RepID=A0AAN7VEW3_9COLE
MIVLYLVVFIWGRVIVGSNGDATTELEASSVFPELYTTTYLPHNEGITAINDGHEQFDMLHNNEKTDNGDDFVQAGNVTEEHEDDEEGFNHADEDYSSTVELDTEKTTNVTIEADFDLINNENGDVTDDLDIFEDNWDDITDDVLNGSFNETAKDIFGSSNNETNGDANHETVDDIFSSSGNGSVFNTSSLDHTEDSKSKEPITFFGKSVEEIYNMTSNGSVTSFISNISGIVDAWLSEKSEVPDLSVTDSHLETAGDASLFTATALNSKGEVCISLNISMQPLLNDTPLQLLPAFVSAETYSMNNGNITFHTADKDKIHNVTINFLIHCDQQSCGLELISVYIRNLSSREDIEAVNHDELCRTKLGSTFEDFHKKSLSMSDGVELQIPYISFFVLEDCVKDPDDSGSFISRYYVQVLCGLATLIIAVGVTFFIYRKIQRRNSNSFDTIM